MKPVRLEVIAPTLAGLGVCSTCEIILAQAEMGRSPAERALEEYPPEWQADLRRLSDWVYGLAAEYGAQIQIRVIDPQSPEGLVKCIRHRVRRYPTWIVGGKSRIAGWERSALAAALHAAGAEATEHA